MFMSKLHRWSAAAVLASAALSFASSASAAPTVRRIIERPMPIRSVRTTRASGMSFAVTPFRFELRSAHAAPVQALPLPPQASIFPALLPRGLAILAVPFKPDACAPPRSATLLSTLSATPFTPLGCERVAPARDWSDRTTSSLVPGHNKNALYGRAYSPHDFDGP
jgi:hypothetical protein